MAETGKGIAMLYEVTSSWPAGPKEQPLRVRDLKRGELAVIIEDSDYYGHHVIMATDDEGTDIALCLEEAKGRCELFNLICYRLRPSEHVTLTVKDIVEPE